MAGSPPDLDTDNGADVGPDREPTTGTPRWVKMFVIIVLVLALVFIVLQLVGGGEHGPGRHGDGEDTPPAGVTEDGGHTPPPGIDHDGQQP